MCPNVHVLQEDWQHEYAAEGDKQEHGQLVAVQSATSSSQVSTGAHVRVCVLTQNSQGLFRNRFDTDPSERKASQRNILLRGDRRKHAHISAPMHTLSNYIAGSVKKRGEGSPKTSERQTEPIIQQDGNSNSSEEGVLEFTRKLQNYPVVGL